MYNKLRRSFEESPNPSRTEIYSEIFEAFMPLCDCDLVLTDYNLLRTAFKVYKADDNGSERYDLMPFASPAIKVSLLFSQNPSIEVTCTTNCYYYLQLTHCPDVFAHDNTFPSSPTHPVTRNVTLHPWLDKCVTSAYGYTVIDEDNLHPLKYNNKSKL